MRPTLICSIAISCLLCVATAGATKPIATTADNEPPAILMLPVELSSSDQLVLRARILDPGGVDEATLWVKGERDEEFRALAMRVAEDGRYESNLTESLGNSRWLTYYVEATDGLGNGPGRNGSPDKPFVLRFDELLQAGDPRPPVMRYLVPLALIGVVLSVFLILSIYSRRRYDLEFWMQVLAPVSELRGDELLEEVRQAAEHSHFHPERGEIEIDPDEAMAWLEKLKQVAPIRLKQTRLEHLSRVRRNASARRLTADQTPERIEEDLFWFHLLGHLVDAPAAKANEVLHVLAGRTHVHPRSGRRIYDVPTLRQHLNRVQGINPAELFARAETLKESAPGVEPSSVTTAETPAPSRTSAGYSLVELLAVLAVIGAVALVGALYLKPLEAPVRTAGEQVDGLIKQTRAKAMSHTTVHRVRPISANYLVVESADTCASMAWTLDPRMDLELPRGVTLSSTAWSVCFGTRGIASDNLVMTLNHADFSSRQLEVLKGGTVRWLQ